MTQQQFDPTAITNFGANFGSVGEEEESLIIFGDWHITDKKSKTHIDYEADCYHYMQEAYQMVVDNKPTYVAHSGDLAGRDSDKNVQSREFLAFTHVWLNRIGLEVDGEQYFTAGNHDEGNHMTDFEYLKRVGAFKTTSHIDIGGEGGMRLHFVNYGDEQRPLDIAEGRYNVVLAHNEFTIARKTDWFFNSAKAIELSTMKHWKGVDFVACGHIHYPSSEILKTSIDGHDVSLFYMGCQLRPDAGEKQTVARPLLFKVTKAGVSLEVIDWHLKEKVFKHQEENDTDEIMDLLNTFSTEENSARLQNREELSETLNSLSQYMIAGEYNFMTQLELHGSIDKEALAFAKEILGDVEQERIKKGV